MKITIRNSIQSTSASTFKPATVKAVANEFKVQVGTLSKLSAKELRLALDKSHMGFGRAVRNFIRTNVKDKIANDPVQLDDSWKEIIKQAIESKMFDPNTFNATELAKLTGKKFKQLDLRMFKDAEAFKKLAARIKKRLVQDLGKDVKFNKLKLTEVFEPSVSLGNQKFNSIEVQLPMRHTLVGTGSNSFVIFLGAGTIYLGENDAKTGRYVDKIRTAKLEGGSAAEVVESVMKMLQVKTTKIEKPTASNAGKASTLILDKFKGELSKLGIEMIPGAADNINFFHPQRGNIKLKFKIGPKGTPIISAKFKASFGEVFDVSRPASLPSIKKFIKKILK